MTASNLATGMETDLTLRQKQLLISARAQLVAITEGLSPAQELYQEVLRLTGEIETLLGY